MKPHQEGTSIGRPLFLIIKNHSHWKVRIHYFFFKIQSKKVWNTIKFGWSPHKVLDREGRLTYVVKLNLKWYRSENDANKNIAKVMYLFSMSLAWMNIERLLHALRLRGLGIFSKWLMKETMLLKCPNFKFWLLGLRPLGWMIMRPIEIFIQNWWIVWILVLIMVNLFLTLK